MPGNASIAARERRRKIIVYIFTALVLIYILLPMLWMGISSFQTERTLQSTPPTFAITSETGTLNHYNFIFTGEIPPDASIMLQAMYTMEGTHVLPAIRNSLIIAVVVTILNLVIGVPAAHAFARIRFRGSEALFLSIFATRMLPAISLVIPMFIIFRTFGILDTLQGLIIINLAITLPFTLWLLRSYFSALPVEVEEAALIDKASRLKILLRIILPMAKPGMIASAAFVFMITFGEFIFALNLTQTIQSKTMPVVIAALATGMSGSKGLIAAASIMSFIPALIIAVIFRKQLIDGLTRRFQ